MKCQLGSLWYSNWHYRAYTDKFQKFFRQASSKLCPDTTRKVWTNTSASLNEELLWLCLMYDNNNNKINYCDSFLCLDLVAFFFLRGRLSFSNAAAVIFLFLLPLQLPFMVLRHEQFMALRAWVFLQNSHILGFSFTLPRCRYKLKNFSSGSWEICSLRKAFTLGRVKDTSLSWWTWLQTRSIVTNNSWMAASPLSLLNYMWTWVPVLSMWAWVPVLSHHLVLLRQTESFAFLHTALPAVKVWESSSSSHCICTGVG